MKIRTAIIGYGRSGSTMHAGAIERNAEFEMAAVCDADPERRRQAAERFHCPVYASYARMLRAEALDLVVIVTRSDQHCRMTCDGLGAGRNVLVTKPWAVNARQAQRMVAAASASGCLLLPWLPARWGSTLLRLKELLADGAIGRVAVVRRAVCSFGTRSDWQTLRRRGGGYLLNWGPHIVDPPCVLIGSPVRSVYGRMRQLINPGDTEDLFFAVLTLADGTLVHVEYTIAVENLPDWFIQGDRGTIVVHGSTIKIHKNTPATPTDPTRFAHMQASGSQVLEETVPGSVYGDEHAVYAEVAQAIQGQRPFPVRPEHALELSRIFDAIRRSNALDRVVKL